MLVSVVFYVWAGGIFHCLGRDFTIGGYRNLYLFPGFSAFWVEISKRRHQESLPFSRDFRLLGRDFQPAALGISTYFRDFHLLGRDSRMTATGFSTFSADFRRLGRDSRMTATEFSIKSI